jgi:hypothetical protein
MKQTVVVIFRLNILLVLEAISGVSEKCKVCPRRKAGPVGTFCRSQLCGKAAVGNLTG